MPVEEVPSGGSRHGGAGASGTLSEDSRVTVFSANGHLYQVGERTETPKPEAPRRPPALVSDGPSLFLASASPLQITRGTPRGWRASPPSACVGPTPSASSASGGRARPR